MKTFTLIFVLSLIVASPAIAREQSLLARVTVYWASGGGGSDACTRQHKCATGAHLCAGHCAVDPKKIAYGSKVVFPDATCTAVDTGRDVINRKAARRSGHTAAERSALVIDRFFETKGQALQWANAHPHFMTVRVLSPNEQLASAKSASPLPKTQTPQAPPNVPAQLASISRDKLIADNTSQTSFQLSRRF